MLALNQEWSLYVLSVLIVYVVVQLLLIITKYLESISENKYNKYLTLGPYECGFDPYDEAYTKVSAKFYIVAILYLLFDLELVFVISFGVIFPFTDYLIFNVITIILIVLLIGFLYERRVNIISIGGA